MADLYFPIKTGFIEDFAVRNPLWASEGPRTSTARPGPSRPSRRPLPPWQRK
jgi:hypothetical protein